MTFVWLWIWLPFPLAALRQWSTPLRFSVERQLNDDGLIYTWVLHCLDAIFRRRSGQKSLAWRMSPWSAVTCHRFPQATRRRRACERARFHPRVAARGPALPTSRQSGKSCDSRSTAKQQRQNGSHLPRWLPQPTTQPTQINSGPCGHPTSAGSTRMRRTRPPMPPPPTSPLPAPPRCPFAIPSSAL